MGNTEIMAKMPRLFGAMFATAAVAACAFAGTAFADDGFEADSVVKFYDDSYALMRTDLEVADDADSDTPRYEYNLIDTNYKVLHTEQTRYEGDYDDFTDYGIKVYDDKGDDPTYKYGLNTYTGKTLLDTKYDSIEYNDDIDNPTVFAVYGDKGKAVIERYARGTSKAIDTLDIAIDAKDAEPHAYIESCDESSVYLRVSYYDEETGKNASVDNLIVYGEGGMKVIDASSDEDSYDIRTIAVEDGMDTVVFNVVRSAKYDSETSSTTYAYRTYLPDGMEVTDLVDYCYGNNASYYDSYASRNASNADVENGVAADKFLFVKTDTTRDDTGKVTARKSTAKLVGKDGTVIATLPEQSMDANGSFTWGICGDYAYVYGYYSVTEEADEGSSTSGDTYTVYLPGKVFNASGNVVKEIAYVSDMYRSTGADDMAKYLVVTSNASFDESKHAYSGRYTTYFDASLNEIPAHKVTSQGASKRNAVDEPNMYMLDGTKLYTSGKFAYDQNDNFVQRAGQYITGIYSDLHDTTTTDYGYSYSSLRIGSTDAFIGTTDNGKFGIVASDGTELAASEYDRVYSQANCELAMVKKEGKWYFVDLSGRARAAMYRLYNPFSGEHFYTASASERDDVVAAGWTDEGEGWTAPGGSTRPVFRLYNPYVGDHHYTTKASERDELVDVGWIDEGVGWFSAVGSNTEVLYREYNPYAETGTHNYTTDKDEHASLIEAGWQNEGTAWSGYKKTLDPIDDANAKADSDASANAGAAASSDLAAASL